MNSNKKSFKPVVAQLKSGVPAQNIKRPVAPPVYRPQTVPKGLQTKRSPNQGTQKGQPPRQPVAPSVYRPEQKRVAQTKLAPPVQQRMASPLQMKKKKGSLEYKVIWFGH